MISIIICSRQKNISKKLYENIFETVGVPFEVICINNSDGWYNICSAYNKGVSKAQYPYLCFMHEDVTFCSKDWGKECIKAFEEPDIWMLGVVGTKYLDATFPYWYPSPFLAGHGMKKNGEISSFDNSHKSQEVVAVDGQWICMKREAFENDLRWDEKRY